MIDRPLDFLTNKMNKEIVITLKDNKQQIGKLLAFDININLVINCKFENKEIFIRGDNIQTIK